MGGPAAVVGAGAADLAPREAPHGNPYGDPRGGRVPFADLPPDRGRGQAAGVPYGVAAYLAAGPLAGTRAGLGAGAVRLELSARVLADGGRVDVARRLEGGRTVGIEAVVG